MGTPQDLSHKPDGATGRIRSSLSKPILSGLTMVFDFVVVAGLGLLIHAIYLREADDPRFWHYVTCISAYVLVLAQTLHSVGMYRFSRIVRPQRYLGRLVGVACVVFLLLLASAFALKVSDQFSRVWAFSWFLSSTFTIVFGRVMIATFVSRWAKRGLLRRNILIYGGGDQGRRLLEYVNSRNEPWNHVVGVFDDRHSRTEPEVAGFPYMGDLHALIEYGNNNAVDEVVLTLPWSANARILNILTLLAPLPVNVKLSPEFVGFDITPRRTSEEFGIPMLEILEKPLSGWNTVAKAIVDFSLGALFMIAALPIMGVIAICIKLESDGPVFFIQKRYGFKNQLIEILKFRTMYAHAADPDASQLTERDDPRVTRVGAVLRRWSLDELPQLLNVLSGEMSVVGPRPHAVRAKAGGRLYEEVVDEYAVRHKVKPGITGWAQVNGWRGNTDTEEALVKRVEHDLYYIENWTVFFDLKILILTVYSIASGKNSY